MPARPGKIVTFYSYKGGTGRSMALANVAWILASQGQKVLVVDWDLEAPGLHRYLYPFLEDPALASCPGVIDLVVEYATRAATRFAGRTAAVLEPAETEWIKRQAKLLPYALPVFWEFTGGGRLDLMPAGQQGPSYAIRVNSFDWKSFYERLCGKIFLAGVRQLMRSEYDYTLIDSRTGVSDTSGICTVELPDTLVVCFSLNHQSIDGASAVAASVRSLRNDGANPGPRLRIIPVPMRVQLGEKDKLERMMRRAQQAFTPLIDGDILGGPESAPQSSGSQFTAASGATQQDQLVRRFFSQLEVPYDPYYAYEETLATFADLTGSVNSVLSAFERLTELVSQGAVKSYASPPEGNRRLIKQAFEEGKVGPAISYRSVAAELIEQLLSTSRPLASREHEFVESFRTRFEAQRSKSLPTSVVVQAETFDSRSIDPIPD